MFHSLTGAVLARPVLAARAEIPIGLQLYSVRTLCAADMPAALAGVGKLGYQAVEFASYHGHEARSLRKMLDDNGLKCCGSHIGFNSLLGDKLAGTVEFNQVLGSRNLIVAGMEGEQYRTSPNAWREAGRIFNEIAEKLKPHGMRVGYHNHESEFRPLDGQTPWDLLCGNTNQDVITQLDIGHAVRAGADPVAALKRYPGRAKTIHVTESERDALIGDGAVKWREVLAACEEVGGTEWYIIEQARSKLPGFEGADEALKRLRRLTG